jgi:hypothetical protein
MQNLKNSSLCAVASLILIFALTFTLATCGGGEDNGYDDSDDNPGNNPGGQNPSGGNQGGDNPGSNGNNSAYTVVYNANGGIGNMTNSTITSGVFEALRTNTFTRGSYDFIGWALTSTEEAVYTDRQSVVVNDSYNKIITLYAVWGVSVIVEGNTLNEKLQWLNSNAVNNTSYILEVNKDEEIYTIINLPLYGGGGKNIAISLRGIGGEKIIKPVNNNTDLFVVPDGVTLILDNDLRLLGRVYVSMGGSLIMKHGIKITGINNNGMGIYPVNTKGTFTMNGGEISNNQSTGVFNDGVFTMNGGVITGNKNETFSSQLQSDYGGGVQNSGTFIMNGGEIHGNTATRTGGGVSSGGTFVMNGGEIYGNTVSNLSGGESAGGGGVYLNYGTFAMNGGKIYGNKAVGSDFSVRGGGGGVLQIQGDFAMNGGEIYGNTASSGSGGGVLQIQGGNFAMNGGEIYGNTASILGGGVCVRYFEKKGGTIFGYTENENNSNVVKNDSGVIQNNSGHAVYAAYNENYYSVKRKETTSLPQNYLYYLYGLWDGYWDD